VRRFKRVLVALFVIAAIALAAGYVWLKPKRVEVPVTAALPSPQLLEAHCREAIGEARVEEVAEGVFVAIGFDLANTILIRTSDGAVVIDVGSNPERALAVRSALLEASPGPVHSVIYTHSHIDHIGGASSWAGDGVDGGRVEIWATDAFVPHLFKQYGLFRVAETRRGARQFGRHVDETALPCSGLGVRPTIDEQLGSGVLMPTRTFTDRAAFELGGLRFELHEAHGETHDQLFVWLPDLGVLMPGDNYYRAFPNLYTIRGTRPRPVNDWLDSLDRMRRLQPTVLVPSHTAPVIGGEAVAEALRDYRDGIQWVRDATVRGANRGQSVDELAAATGLPEHLAEVPSLQQLYGQIDWSVRAIYDNELGWFDERAESLYPLAPSELALRTVEAMGGAQSVLELAREAAQDDDHRWALHLTSLIDSLPEAARSAVDDSAVDVAAAGSLRALAEGVFNTNGRAYLLEAASERQHGEQALPDPQLGDGFIDGIPLSLLFDVMAIRLEPELSIDTHESVRFEFPSVDQVFHVTVRRGVAEVAAGAALPDAPPPLATVRTEPAVWRRVALGLTAPREAIGGSGLEVDGDLPGFIRFVQRFERGM